jgi:hypothetical protein
MRSAETSKTETDNKTDFEKLKDVIMQDIARCQDMPSLRRCVHALFITQMTVDLVGISKGEDLECSGIRKSVKQAKKKK